MGNIKLFFTLAKICFKIKSSLSERLLAGASVKNLLDKPALI